MNKKILLLVFSLFSIYSTANIRKLYYPSIDWSNFLGNVKDQSLIPNCKHSWAAAIVDAIEGAFNFKYKNFPPVNLAIQQLMNCVSNSCNDESIDILDPMGYLQSNGLIFQENLWRFNPTEQCYQMDNLQPLVFVDGYSYCNPCDFDQWYGLLEKGPIVSLIDGERLKNAKDKEVLDPESCEIGDTKVVVVGYDSEEDAIIIRYSQGHNWQDDGYMRVKRNNETKSCFLTQIALLPEVSFNGYQMSIPAPDEEY